MSAFWLVQRLSRQNPGSKKTGFGAVFAMDYMGSAEYEFRTPFESLKRMRSYDLVVVHKQVDSCAGRPLGDPQSVFFVGPEDSIVAKLDSWDEWCENPKSKEQTHFPENLTGVDWKHDPIDDYYRRTIAWWSFDSDLAWTLDSSIAKELVTAFTGESA